MVRACNYLVFYNADATHSHIIAAATNYSDALYPFEIMVILQESTNNLSNDKNIKSSFLKAGH